MTAKDRASDSVQRLTGAGKEAAGRVTGDRDLEDEGKADQVTASAKKLIRDVADDVKSAVKSVKRTTSR